MNIWIDRLKMKVVGSRGFNVDIHPNCNFSNIYSISRQYGGKGMSHHMGGHPFTFLAQHVVIKRPSEIVTVAPCSMLHIGAQAIIKILSLSQVSHQKRTKILCKPYLSLSSVFDSEGLFSLLETSIIDGTAYPHGAMLQIKPISSGFHDFKPSQAGFKSTIQDEFQVIIGGIFYKFIFQTLVTPLDATFGKDYWQFNRVTRVFVPRSFLLNSPIEKCANPSDVRNPCGLGNGPFLTSGQPIVKTLNVSSPHRGNRCAFGQGFEKVLQNKICFGHRRSRVLPLSRKRLVNKKSLNIGVKSVLSAEQGLLDDLRGKLAGFRIVGSKQVNPTPFAVNHLGKPISAFSKINVFHSGSQHCELGSQMNVLQGGLKGILRGKTPWSRWDSNPRPPQCHDRVPSSVVHTRRFTISSFPRMSRAAFSNQ